MKNNSKYDLIIFGGGAAGCSCAYNAGIRGLKVLLIEKNSYLGGSITSSLVIPAMKTSENAVNTDFFNKLYNELHDINGASEYCDGNKGWFNPELTKIALDKILLNANVDIIFEAEVKSIEEKLSSYIVTISTNNYIAGDAVLLPCIESKYIVDSTGNAKICQKLNCEFLNDNSNQPASLRFIMSGIDITEFSSWLLEYDKNRCVTTCCQADGNTLLSTAYTWDTNIDWALRPIFNKAVENGDITDTDANYFQIFSVAGTSDSVAFNCPRIIGNDLTCSEAYIKGRESILRLSNFCKKYFPGFKNSYISSIANTLGIRVSRRVKCKYVYSSDDLKSGKKFDNPVVISDYPIDIHSSNKNESKLENLCTEYQLPIEALMVKDNLFVAGRCISADFESIGALRIIPSCFSMGEGVAKHIAKALNRD